MRADEALKEKVFVCETPEDTFDLGERIGESLRGGEMILLSRRAWRRQNAFDERNFIRAGIRC
jgi:hypothetical protein